TYAVHCAEDVDTEGVVKRFWSNLIDNAFDQRACCGYQDVYRSRPEIARCFYKSPYGSRVRDIGRHAEGFPAPRAQVLRGLLTSISVSRGNHDPDTRGSQRLRDCPPDSAGTASDYGSLGAGHRRTSLPNSSM